MEFLSRIESYHGNHSLSVNRLDVDKARMITLYQDAGAMHFQFSMNAEQARRLAYALAVAADNMEDKQ